MNSLTSEELATDLDHGFAAFVDSHSPMVLTLATRLTDANTGQDITQEVFLRAYQALRGYGRDRVAKLDSRPWLATITRNLVRNEYRRRERRSTVPLKPLDQDVSRAQKTEAEFDAVTADDHLNQLLSSLSDAQREAVVLRHIVGLSMRDVALTMGCPQGTAKSHVSRGLETLRAILSQSAGRPKTNEGDQS